MLEGLEISEVNFRYVAQSSDIFRIDSFFFSKEFLIDEKKISKSDHKTFTELNATLRSFGAYSLNNDVEYLQEGIPFIRGVNLKNGLVDFSDMIFIDRVAHGLLWKSEVKPETLLLSMSGTIGDVAIALPHFDYPINSNQDIAKIELNESNIDPYYVYSFLRSKYGQNYLRREARGSVQQHVFLSQMASFKIPLFNENFQREISAVVKKGFALNEASKKFYREAEDILLQELGLKDWKPQMEIVSVKSFADFSISGRLDAEYYQPKYDDLFAHLKKYETKPLNQIITISKSIEPGSDAYQESGIPFVRVSNLSKYGLTEPDIHLDRATYETEILKPKKDTILLSKDGSVGIAYKLEQDLDVITSGAILHLNINDKEFLPDYLTLVLNSIIVKMQAERDSGGSIIQHWKPSEIEQVIIPKLKYNIQQQITDKVQKSFELQAESKRLLDLAKTAVEIAIEQGEQEALKLL